MADDYGLIIYDNSGNIDIKRTIGGLPGSDLDAGRLLASWRPGELFHLTGDRQWYLWEGRYLKPDDSALAGRMVNYLADVLGTVIMACQRGHAAMAAAGAGEVSQATMDKTIRDGWAATWGKYPAVGYARGLRSSKGAASLRESMAVLLGVAPGFLADQHPYWLNAGDRIAVLLPAAGEPWDIPHDPRWRMTYCVDTRWEPGAECPEFKQLLWLASGKDQDVYHYLVKALGYSLLGRNPKHLVFFLSGPTANGKTTITSIVSKLLGPRLACEAKPELITRPRGGSRHPRHEASLRGMRLVTISETNDQLVIDENQLKALTGAETIAVELLYDKTLTMTDVTWVIFVANNEMPSLAHLDPALRRRIIVIPMGPTIPEEQRDDELARRILRSEREGILQLLAWGAREAMRGEGGITDLPLAVEMKTMEYAELQNQVAAWHADCCIPAAMANGSPGPVVEGSECYDSYWAWIKDKNLALSRKNFHAQLRMLPGVVFRGDQNHARYTGFMIRGVAADWTR